jgi:hypothetical protein
MADSKTSAQVKQLEQFKSPSIGSVLPQGSTTASKAAEQPAEGSADKNTSAPPASAAPAMATSSPIAAPAPASAASASAASEPPFQPRSDRTTLFDRTQRGYWEKPLLNYDTYLLLAVAGGFFAIDQLYLRSPLSFAAKLLGNIFLFGIPWLYDILQGFLNTRRVKLFGTSAPFVGQIGAGAGMFIADGEMLAPADADKRWNFLIYSLVLMFTGLLGGDSYLLGDTLGGMIRTGLCLTIVLLPVAAVWWGAKLWEYFANTGTLLDNNWEYFGAPEPKIPVKRCPGVLEEITIWVLKTARVVLRQIPGFGMIATMLDGLISSLEVAYGVAEAAVNEGIGAMKAVSQIQGTLGSLGTGFEPGAAFSKRIEKLAETEGAKPAKDQAGGGSAESTSPAAMYGLLGTLALIIVSGGGRFLKEVWQNVGRRQRSSEVKNDRPPEPGAL